MELKLGFLASHGGSNMSAILEAIENGRLAAQPCVVISNNKESKALQTAREKGLPGYHVNAKTEGTERQADIKILQLLQEHDVNLVILNGYMKKIGPETLHAFDGRILNVHPALLPKYGGQGMYGKFVHEAVLAAGEKVTGVTIHVIDEEYDRGAILGQTEVPVLPGDTPETLAARVLAREKEFYVEILQKIASDEIVLSPVESQGK